MGQRPDQRPYRHRLGGHSAHASEAYTDRIVERITEAMKGTQ